MITIYNGHNLGWYQDEPDDLANFGIPAGVLVVGFAGRDRPGKGVKYLVDSAKWLPSDAPVHYLLIEKMENNSSLLNQIAESPLRDNFHLAGFRENAPAIMVASLANP